MQKIKRILFVLAFLISVSGPAQEISGIAALNSQISESSGLELVDGRLLSILDSGNENIVYEIDTLNGQILREVFIGNAVNTDWESITVDDTYIYIGDFGNNNGTRQDLKIYKIPISEYLESESTQTAEVISFNYADQTSFASSPFTTNFDAEAFCSYGDSLILFSKNWGNQYSKVYKISKEPGNYSVTYLDSINAEGLVSGCHCDEENGIIHLIGYNTSLAPFVGRLTNFTPEQITDGNFERQALSTPVGQSSQIEGIAHSFGSKFFVTSEAFFGADAWLFDLEWSIPLSTRFPDQTGERGLIVPNPNSGSFKIQADEYTRLKIIDSNGKSVFESPKSNRYETSLKPGLYTLILSNSDNERKTIQKLLIINR